MSGLLTEGQARAARANKLTAAIVDARYRGQHQLAEQLEQELVLLNVTIPRTAASRIQALPPHARWWFAPTGDSDEGPVYGQRSYEPHFSSGGRR
jgi:hypothetical protein